MSALKKKITSHNVSNFLEKNLLVFFFNHNHINIQEWRVIKNQLSLLEKVSKIVVKNQIGNNVVRKKSGTGNIHNEEQPFCKLSTLFQGPTFLIGTSSPHLCEALFNITKKQKKLIFVGGLYQGQYINHLDLLSILKGEKRVYTNLISLFQSNLYTCIISTYLMPLYSLLKSYSVQELGKKRD